MRNDPVTSPFSGLLEGSISKGSAETHRRLAEDSTDDSVMQSLKNTGACRKVQQLQNELKEEHIMRDFHIFFWQSSTNWTFLISKLVFGLPFLLSIFNRLPPHLEIAIYAFLELASKALLSIFSMSIILLEKERDIHERKIIRLRVIPVELKNDTLHWIIQALKRADESKRRFMRYIFHEIRVPMHSLTVCMELLDEKLNHKEKLLQNMIWSVELMRETLNDVLLVHQMEERGTLPLTKRFFRLDDFLAQTVARFQGGARRKNQRLSIEGSVPAVLVYADDRRLSQALGNGISNSIKATPTDGEIIVRVSSTDFPPGVSKARVERDYPDLALTTFTFQITDNGVGLSKEQLDRLNSFNPFQTEMDANATLEEDSSGLGLAITNEVCRRHHGSCHLSSPGKGKGTTFTIETPLESILASDVERLSARLRKSIEDNTAQMVKLRERTDIKAGQSYQARPSTDISPASRLRFSLVDENEDYEFFIGHGSAAASPCLAKRKTGQGTGARNRSRPPASRQSESGEQIEPISIDKSATAVAANLPLQKDAKIRCLCVDDGKRRFAAQLCCAEDTIDRANNGREAVELVKQKAYDVVLMDVCMPIMNGTEATEKLRALRFAGRVIGLPANVISEDRQKMVQAGANEVIAKGSLSKEFVRERFTTYFPDTLATCQRARTGSLLSTPALLPTHTEEAPPEEISALPRLPVKRSTKTSSQMRRHASIKTALHHTDRRSHREAQREEEQTVLVVDDDETCRQATSLLLQYCGRRYRLHVIEAADGLEGLEIVKKSPQKPDLIFMDLLMPRMDGLEATKAIRESGHAGAILGLSANLLEEDVEHLLNAGVSAVIAKGQLTKQVMTELLDKHLSTTAVQPSQPMSSESTSPRTSKEKGSRALLQTLPETSVDEAALSCTTSRKKLLQAAMVSTNKDERGFSPSCPHSPRSNIEHLATQERKETVSKEEAAVLSVQADASISSQEASDETSIRSQKGAMPDEETLDDIHHQMTETDVNRDVFFDLKPVFVQKIIESVHAHNLRSMSHLWCSSKQEMITKWCRKCDTLSDGAVWTHHRLLESLCARFRVVKTRDVTETMEHLLTNFLPDLLVILCTVQPRGLPVGYEALAYQAREYDDTIKTVTKIRKFLPLDFFSLVVISSVSLADDGEPATNESSGTSLRGGSGRLNLGRIFQCGVSAHTAIGSLPYGEQDDYMVVYEQLMSLVHQQRARNRRLVAANAQTQEAQNLLAKILPMDIIQRMHDGEQLIADAHPSVTIFFSDIVGFTSITSQVPTASMVLFLNKLFGKMDSLSDKYGCYKVETIGDAYMCASGHDGKADHVICMLKFAIAVQQEASKMKLPNGEPLRMRVGLHTGPAFTGVVGRKCPRFCFFGDTVNTAARMEQTGMPQCIHISARLRNGLRDIHDKRPQTVKAAPPDKTRQRRASVDSDNPSDGSLQVTSPAANRSSPEKSDRAPSPIPSLILEGPRTKSMAEPCVNVLPPASSPPVIPQPSPAPTTAEGNAPIALDKTKSLDIPQDVLLERRAQPPAEAGSREEQDDKDKTRETLDERHAADLPAEDKPETDKALDGLAASFSRPPLSSAASSSDQLSRERTGSILNYSERAVLHQSFISASTSSTLHLAQPGKRHPPFGISRLLHLFGGDEKGGNSVFCGLAEGELLRVLKGLSDETLLKGVVLLAKAQQQADALMIEQLSQKLKAAHDRVDALEASDIDLRRTIASLQILTQLCRAQLQAAALASSASGVSSSEDQDEAAKGGFNELEHPTWLTF
ncbi:unnamed protein product [Vitrella brassicaformis CCMP3155]|uniref:histidine kinase n=5 Tax=Vitrella brassicaformis TaxID=1169539 RepID=A0A0G4EB57_VITBC|nr:unnamed protein product [Vitrella brassicaformis CCMP3155]|eukprot:CEL93190.1 unnamed protein product [Vitrella brassicaformis CCMP3155]